MVTDHVLQCHISTVLEQLQGWCPHLPVPVPHFSFWEIIFPNIQPERPLAQLKAISSQCCKPFFPSPKCTFHTAGLKVSTLSRSNLPYNMPCCGAEQAANPTPYLWVCATPGASWRSLEKAHIWRWQEMLRVLKNCLFQSARKSIPLLFLTQHCWSRSAKSSL